MMTIRNNRRGFTLLECVLTMTILGFIGAVVTSTMMYGVKIYHALQTESTSVSQVKVAGQVLRRLVSEKYSGEIRDVQDQFVLENGTVYWNGKVFLEGVQTWTIKPKVLSATSTSGEYSQNPVIHFTLVMKNPAGGDPLRYKYEFHPQWEPAK